MWPVSIRRLASSRWPVSNTSSSGVTPASRIATAIASRCAGVLMKTWPPMFMLPMSRLQISGLELDHVLHALGRRLQGGAGAGLHRIVGAGHEARARAGGEVDEHVGAARADAVDHLAVERAVHAGRVVCGSRTWMWTIAAPALAASIAEAAICAGVTGTAGFFAGESAEPVTAQEIMTLRCIIPPHVVAVRRIVPGAPGGRTAGAGR